MPMPKKPLLSRCWRIRPGARGRRTCPLLREPGTRWCSATSRPEAGPAIGTQLEIPSGMLKDVHSFHLGAQRCPSIQVELRLVLLCQAGVLFALVQETVSGRQGFHIRAHEAVKRVFRSTHNGFAANVEAGVHNYGATGALVELLQQGVVAG